MHDKGHRVERGGILRNLVPRRPHVTADRPGQDAPNERYWKERGRDFQLHEFSGET